MVVFNRFSINDFIFFVMGNFVRKKFGGLRLENNYWKIKERVDLIRNKVVNL